MSIGVKQRGLELGPQHLGPVALGHTEVAALSEHTCLFKEQKASRAGCDEGVAVTEHRGL